MLPIVAAVALTGGTMYLSCTHNTKEVDTEKTSLENVIKEEQLNNSLKELAVKADESINVIKSFNGNSVDSIDQRVIDKNVKRAKEVAELLGEMQILAHKQDSIANLMNKITIK